MDNIVPLREIAKPAAFRHSSFRERHSPAFLRSAYPFDSARFPFAADQHILLVGATTDALNDVSAHLRIGERTRVEHVLFHAGLDDCHWHGELQAKLEDVFGRSWRAPDVSIFVVRDGFTAEQFAAVMAGLQFIPRPVYLVSAESANAEATVHALQQPRFGSMQRILKRLVDLAGGSVLLLFLTPLMLLIALLVKFDSKGPVFFRQRRLGFLGKPFDIYKFRTMSVQENGDNVVQARRHDPRVTRVGGFLRRSSLDELPQLFNVIKGDMSLVGPRPHAEAHDRHYSAIVPRYTLRRYVKPGMTGWAQVHGYRGQISSMEDIARRVEYDSWYARNATVLLDIQILVRTVAIVFNQKNAY